MSNFAEVIRDLSGTVDGANTDFTTSTPYVAGTIRVFVNGILYSPSDTQWGYTELDDTTIRMTTAPLSGYTMQAFYREQIAEGSPFHPTGSYP